MADTLTRSIAFRVPLPVYFALLEEAGKSGRTIADHIGSIFFSAWHDGAVIKQAQTYVSFGKTDAEIQEEAVATAMRIEKLKEYNKELEEKLKTL